MNPERLYMTTEVHPGMHETVPTQSEELTIDEDMSNRVRRI